jgi:uncharacterized protein DUF5681
MSKPKKTYDIGYRKPPTHSQIKKGQSGNPSGRQKQQKTLIEELSDVLEERVVVKENDGKKTITIRQAVFKQFAKQGAMGKP